MMWHISTLLRLFLTISWGLFIKGGCKIWQMMIWWKPEAYNFKVIKYSQFWIFTFSGAVDPSCWRTAMISFSPCPPYLPYFHHRSSSSSSHHHHHHHHTVILNQIKKVNIQRQLLFRNSTCVICQSRKSYFYHLWRHVCISLRM